MKKAFLTIILFLGLPLQSMASATPLEIIIDNSSVIDYLKTDVPPIIQNDRTFVPIRAISEFLKLKVDFQSESNRVLINGDGKTIALTIGDPSALVNGVRVPLEAPPILINDRTMVPLRFVSEALGYQVYYYDKNVDGSKTIWITKYTLIKNEEILQMPPCVPVEGSAFKRIDPDLPNYQLAPEGETPSRIRLGDSLEKVKETYGIPAAEKFDYLSGNGILDYWDPFYPGSEISCLRFTFSERVLQRAVLYY